MQLVDLPCFPSQTNFRKEHPKAKTSNCICWFLIGNFADKSRFLQKMGFKNLWKHLKSDFFLSQSREVAKLLSEIVPFTLKSKSMNIDF
ncbi:MAG: hypothetical protein FWG29_01050 [Treponema sp.]|nr:hypothetical protein [Treponema sp.]